MPIWKTQISPAALNERCRDTLVAHLGIEFTEVGDDFLVAKMPVVAAVLQPAGILHGGASCVLAETAGSGAANFCVDQSQFYCVGLELNINHLRAKGSGWLLGRASPFHLGRRTQVWSIEIRDEKNELIAISRHTVMVLEKS